MLEKLRVFLVVLEEGSLRRAADRLRIAVGLGVAVAINLSWQGLARQRAERAALQSEFGTLRAETEETASRLGLLAHMNYQPTQPSSEVLRLRGDISRLSRELKELEAASPTNYVSASNRAQRDQIALQAFEQFEGRKQARSQQLSSVLQALNQAASQHSDFAFFEPDGKVAPSLAQLFPAVPWDEVEVLCHDSKTLRFLQSLHPDEIVVAFVQPLLDPAGERIRIGIRANGEVMSAPEASFHRQLGSSSGQQVDEATLSREWKQFQGSP